MGENNTMRCVINILAVLLYGFRVDTATLNEAGSILMRRVEKDLEGQTRRKR